MSLNIYHFFLGLVFAGLIIISSAETSNLENLTCALASLYGPQYEQQLNVEQMRENLTLANKFYLELKETGSEVPEHIEELGVEVASLIVAKALVGSNCKKSSSSLRFIKNIAEKHRSKSKQILCYLDHLQNEHMLKCQEEYSIKLKEAVDNLDPEAKLNGEVLWSYIKVARPDVDLHPRSHSVPYNNIFAGLCDFVKTKTGPISNSGSDQDYLDLFEDVLIKTCEPIHQTIWPVIETFEELTKSYRAIKGMNEFTILWSRLGEACGRMRRHPIWAMDLSRRMLAFKQKFPEVA